MTVRESLHQHFPNFVYAIWKHLRLDRPTPNQLYAAEFLQFAPLRAILEAFRGLGKSWLTAAYVLWCLDNDAEEKFLVTSASKRRADAFTIFTKRLITEIAFLQYLMPDPRKDQRDSNVCFDVGPSQASQAPSVQSVGIFGQMTGSRATKIIGDDDEIPSNSATPDQREKLIDAITEYESIILPGGKILFLGTPQTEESIYDHLGNLGYTKFQIPSEHVAPEKRKDYVGLAPHLIKLVDDNPFLVGSSTEPTRFTDEDLLGRRARMGNSNYMLQFMLDTSLSDKERYPLRTKDFIVLQVNETAPVSVNWTNSPLYQMKGLRCVGFKGDGYYSPILAPDTPWAEFTGTIMAIDPSGRGSDELAYAIISELNGFLYLRKVGGFKEGYTDDTLDALAIAARDFKVTNIVIEDNFGDGMFTKLFYPRLIKIYRTGVEDIHHLTNKEKRVIDTIEPVLNQHRLVVCPSVIEDDLKIALHETEGSLNYSVIYQMTHIMKKAGCLAHEDRLEAVSIALAKYADLLRQDPELAEDRWRRESLERDIEHFLSDAVLKLHTQAMPPKAYGRDSVGLSGGRSQRTMHIPRRRT